jgi:hypothetical protein
LDVSRTLFDTNDTKIRTSFTLVDSCLLVL